MTAKLPDSILKRSVFAIGTPGAGKSHGVAEGIVIPLLKREQQAVIIDPTDAWFGLAMSKSGKQPSGFNITVFGGEHGSVPLTPNMGRAMGDLLGREPISAILSIWHFSLQEQIEFVSDFSAAIMEVNRKPITLVIDESDEFIPQKPELGKELLKCKLRTKRIVTRGRKSGFRPVLITQRPQALDTAARNGCQVMMAFQCTGHHERTQIEDYVKSNGDPKTMKDMLSSLVELKVGQAWVWAPRDKYLECIQFPKIDVFDSFDAIDENSVKIKTVPVSGKRLETIEAALADFEEQRKANDPELLKKKIRSLESAVVARSNNFPPAPAVPDKAALNAARNAGYNEAIEAATKWQEKWIKEMRLRHVVVVDKLDQLISEIDQPPTLLKLHVEKPSVKSNGAVHPVQVQKPNARTPVVNDPNNPLTTSQRKMLNALAWWKAMGNEQPTNAMVGVVAGYRPSSGGINNILSELSTLGYVARSSGRVSLTHEGAALTDIQQRGSMEELQKRARDILTGPQLKMFDAVMSHYPDDIENGDAGEQAGYQRTSGGINNILSELSTMSLVERHKGRVKAADWLFG